MKLFLILFSISGSVLAGAGGGTPADLVAPAVNVFILASFLIWKLKGPVNSFFQSKSETIKESLHKADLRAKEIEKLYLAEKEKMGNLPSALEEAKKDGEKEISSYKTEQESELVERLKDLKEDADAKIKAEGSAAADELTQILVQDILEKTKGSIAADQTVSSNINKKLLEEVK